MRDGLVLRDIHASAAPSWWPPAPGWWFVFAAIVLACALGIAWGVHRRRRRLRIERLFDDGVAAAGAPVQQVAAISELLRRAARRRDAGADRLQGEDWLRFLDADAKTSLFDGATGQLLRDGGFRRDVDRDAVAALRIAARTRFIEWMAARR